MDVASANIIKLVTTLNERYERFVELGDIFSNFGYDCALSLNIAGTPFTITESARSRELLAIAFFDLEVKSRNNEESSLNMYLLWDKPFWVIRTEIWVEAEIGGTRQLHSFPERQVKTFEECIIHFEASIDDLFANHHLLIEWLTSKGEVSKQSTRSGHGSLVSSRLLPSGVKLH